MTKYEYSTLVIEEAKFRRDEFDMRLKSFGADGWELVNVFSVDGRDAVPAEVVAVFKRSLG